jgi:phosphatidylinositol-3-phosphatase
LTIRPHIYAFVAIAALVTATVVTTRTAPAWARHAASSPAVCGALAGRASHISHVIWIWEENHSYDQIIGSPAAPYLNNLAKQCGSASNYHSISHPSAPNYIAATSGLPLSQLPASDCTTNCHNGARSLFGQTTWRAYQESMPKNCSLRNSGSYVVRHNPPTYFDRLASCSTDDVPLSKLAGDLATGSLPAFAFVTPNLDHDMHNGGVQPGDAWLARQLPLILDSTAYRSGDTAIVITWDEGSGGGTLKGTNCVTSASPSCHIPAIVISPYTRPGTVDPALRSHYSLLRTTEEILGLPLLGQAATATSMRRPFGLG